MSFSKNTPLAAAILWCLAISSNASADIIMSIDTTAKTLSFTGTDTGTSTNAQPFLGWSVGTTSGGASGVSPDAYLTYSSINPPSRNMTFFDSGFEIGAAQFFPAGFTSTITGTGVAYNYGVLPVARQSYVESLVGMSINPQAGNTLSPMQVQGLGGGAAVPEPSSFVLLGLAGIGFGVHRIRWRQQPSESMTC